MYFFKFEGSLSACEATALQGGDRPVLRARARRLRIASDLFNGKQRGTICFVSHVDEGDVTFGMLTERICTLTAAKEKMRQFAKAVFLPLEDLTGEEITFHTMLHLLSSADHENLISDDDDLLEQIGIAELNDHRCVSFGENILQVSSKEKVLENIRNLGVESTMVPELERIYASPAQKRPKGHPVHYMVQTDDRVVRRTVYRELLRALQENGRLTSSRYAFVDFRPGDDFFRRSYDALYRAAEGGAVVVRYLAGADSGHGGYADAALDTIRGICETMSKYRNTVLTVLCLPRECTRTKALFYENLTNLSLVEVKEEHLRGEEARTLLKQLARDNKIRSDKKLMAKVEEDRGYLVPDLKNLFNEWYDLKLRTAVYPQYKDVDTVNCKVVKAAPRGSAYEQLQEMIGLDNAKGVLDKALNFYKMQKLCKDKGIAEDHPAMHMVFTGNPGSAKTTVARLFAEVMRDNGVLSRGHLVEVGRADLVGKYVGWTAKIVKEKFRAAKGGVLFLDEAYSLNLGESGSFGQEAIDTIVQEMENCREELVVIFAGYPKEMEAFLQSNPGLRSRIAFHVPFDDYNAEELTDIARLMAKNKGLKVTEEALEKIHGICEGVCNRGDFGNGRYVRNVLEQAKMNQASRLMKADFDSLTAAELTTICAEDVVAPVLSHESARTQLIGFAG